MALSAKYWQPGPIRKRDWYQRDRKRRQIVVEVLDECNKSLWLECWNNVWHELALSCGL
jgi:hypothetical protein